MCFLILFDPLYEEIVTNSSELMVYLTRHFVIELVLPLSIFIGTMLTFYTDWSWIPITNSEKGRNISLEEVKKNLIE